MARTGAERRDETAQRRERRRLGGGQVPPSARCMLRSRWKYLCRRMGAVRAHHAAAEGELALRIEINHMTCMTPSMKTVSLRQPWFLRLFAGLVLGFAS